MAKEDLIPFNKRTEEELKAMTRKGGINSGKARRNKARLKDCLEALLESKIMDAETGKMVTGAEAMTVSLFKRAIAGDDKAWELFRDTVGQKLPDKIEQTSTNITIDFGDISENGN